MNLTPENYNPTGLRLAILGSIVSCIGVVVNNILFQHILAMQIWAVSNILLMLWAYGVTEFTIKYRWFEYTKGQWWNCGISGIVLCVMYTFYTLTNIWGITR